MKQNGDVEKKRVISGLGILAYAGLSMAASVVGFLILGKLLDDAFGTRPWLMLLLILLGIAAAIYSLYKISGLNGRKHN